jgi:3-(3-hydroxy-phenyl)propionate hydroxylase
MSSDNRARVQFAAAPLPAIAAGGAERVPVVIAGAGLVGLTLAIDLTLKGVPIVLLEKRDAAGEGSRSICQAKRTLEIWDRLGAAPPMLARGITWKTGRVFHRDRLLYSFDLLPESGHKMPAFINLQQFYVEEALIERLTALGGCVRWCHELSHVEPHENHVSIGVTTPAGSYRVDTDWLIDCEGVRSHVRRALGLEFGGEIFPDKFLICDVKMRRSDFPSERWFWFEPPFHSGQTALLHRQADDVWRIDLQLSPDADPETERQPARVTERIRRMLGHPEFSLEWVSVYVFQCRTLERYVHGPIVFAGDSAHQVSPFGARGGNGGVQDADNLAWKLARLIAGRGSPRLLESYDSERRAAALENILNSTRATDFMSPKTRTSRTLRDQALELAAERSFARALVNPGRLSVAAHLKDSPLNSPDRDPWPSAALAPGSPALDAPTHTPGGKRWLLESLAGAFTLLIHPDPKERTPDAHVAVDGERIDVLALGRDVEDSAGLLARRYDLTPGSGYLLRPDQHVVARWRRWSIRDVEEAARRALGKI